MPNAPKPTPLVQHVTDVQLVSYQDGEMSRAEFEIVIAHVESCWTCRSRLGAVQESIDRFLEARRKLLPEPPPFSEARVEQFRQRLMRHADESRTAGPSAWQQLRLGMGRGLAVMAQHRKAALASALAACLLVVMFTDVLNTRVSADTVLSRAQNYEIGHQPHKGQVSKIAVRVESINRKSGAPRQLGTIVAVRDSETPATYWDVHSDAASYERSVNGDSAGITGNMLRAVLEGDPANANFIDYLDHQQWLPDVSINGFRRLVSARGSTEVSAKKSGDEFELRYPFAPGHSSGIAEARLLVNAKDYEPTSISILTVAERAQEYRFTRVSATTEPRTMELAHLTVPPGIAEISSTHSGTNSNPSLPVHKVVPLGYASTHATVEEVEVAEALHKVDACLGEEVYLFPMSDGSLLVQGLVDSSARREAIKDSLKSVSGMLRVEIYVPRELKNGSELYNPPDRFSDSAGANAVAEVTIPASLADLSSASMPLHDRIFKHLSRSGAASQETEKEVAIFSNEIVTHARQTFLHAWALKKLDREFSAERVAGLPQSALRQIDKIRQDHQNWIANLAQRQVEMLSDIADMPTASGMTEAVAGHADPDTLLRLAREQNDLVRSLFTTSEQAPEASASLSRLITVLRHMGS
jgi:anti-sigma factor RsiW